MLADIASSAAIFPKFGKSVISKRLAAALEPVLAAIADEQQRGALRPGMMATIELPATALIELLDAAAVEGEP